MNTKGNTHEELRIKHREEVSTLLEPLYEPRFDDEFLTMLALMLQGKLRQEHLKDDATGQYLLESVLKFCSGVIGLPFEQNLAANFANFHEFFPSRVKPLCPACHFDRLSTSLCGELLNTLLEVLIMILSNQIRMRGESDKVSWWLNEELTELVGEASRELDWGKFTTLAAEAL